MAKSRKKKRGPKKGKEPAHLKRARLERQRSARLMGATHVSGKRKRRKSGKRRRAVAAVSAAPKKRRTHHHSNSGKGHAVSKHRKGAKRAAGSGYGIPGKTYLQNAGNLAADAGAAIALDATANFAANVVCQLVPNNIVSDAKLKQPAKLFLAGLAGIIASKKMKPGRAKGAVVYGLKYAFTNAIEKVAISMLPANLANQLSADDPYGYLRADDRSTPSLPAGYGGDTGDPISGDTGDPVTMGDDWNQLADGANLSGVSQFYIDSDGNVVQ